MLKNRLLRSINCLQHRIIESHFYLAVTSSGYLLGKLQSGYEVRLKYTVSL